MRSDCRRPQFKIRREDVINGVLDAIDRARLEGEPNTEIQGWKEVAKLMGYYAPEVLKVQLTDDQARWQKQFEGMSDEELLKLTVTEQPEVAAVVV